ncbi:hypothetical protein QR680_013338 [Steinernema hermaphroditum]|uniref:Major facilitator superfamily (MFS) profile domain-containing protein n=1 Tax=Steinernema hermaphroditum TaxID=289476 RepID=A0AA39I7H1_9BILA|nr:hypothetical protein QR680_013338 [Steinernema hermaphroditum]
MFPIWLVYVIVVHGVLSTSNTVLEMMLNSVSLPLQRFFNDSVHEHYGVVLDAQGMSLVVSLMPNVDLLGFLCSLLFVVPLMDSHGRRFVSVSVRSASVVLSASCFTLAKYANSVELYALGQFLLGFVQPMKMIVVKIYLTECVPDRFRGLMALAVGSCLFFASLASTVLYLPSLFGNDARWHLVPMICAAMDVVYFCLARWLPESPKWLMDADHPKQEVVEAIRFYHGGDAHVEAVMEEVREEIAISAHHRMSLRQVYRSQTFRSVFKIIFLAVLSSSLSMIVITQSYTQQLLLGFGYSVENVFLLTGLLQALSVPVLVLNPFLYERLGRRPMFLFSAFCSIVNIAFLFAAKVATEVAGVGVLSRLFATLSMLLGNLASASGVVIAFIVFIADLLPPGAKVSVTQFVLLVNLFIQIPAVFFFGNLFTAAGSWTFVPFLAVQITIFVYMYLNLPETKQLSVTTNVRNVRSHLSPCGTNCMTEALDFERSSLTQQRKRNTYGT